MSKLAAPIWVESTNQAQAAVRRAAALGAAMVELRLDRVAHEPAMAKAVVQAAELPCIVTCRPSWEGGYFEGDDSERLALFEAIGTAERQPAYLDLELAAWQQRGELRDGVAALVSDPAEANDTAPGLILSAHDFEGRPTDLLRRLEAMASEPRCRVIKLAWQARSLRDNLEAFELLRQQVKPMICLCMGEFGLPTRVLAPKFGGLVSFAALDGEAGSAAGQLTLGQMKRSYRWDTLNPATAVYGVVGYPVGHSMSPPLHNAGFEAIGHDGVYLPMPIHAEYEQFKATVGSWLAEPGVNLGGLSVTIPHKENLLRYVASEGGQIESLAEAIGAANTLARRPDGTLYACNTDYAAALDAACAAMGIERSDLAGRRIAVIGAGGAARAIVAGFAHQGAAVTVYNRSPEKARALVDRFDGQTGPVRSAALDAMAGAEANVWINCTPLGMAPKTDASPVADAPAQQPAWGVGTVVFDTIYNPPRTKLLQQAEAAGATTISGIEMFVRQGAAQFELWTHQPAPLDTFREVMRRHLSANGEA